jgi:hypothetical protein
MIIQRMKVKYNLFNKSSLDSKKRNKRRSKADMDGRNHKCQSCGKSYLSYPALYTHMKTKHASNGQTTGRGRGRPKKDTGETINTIRLLYNSSTMDYFKHPERVGEVTDINHCLSSTFSEIFNPNHLERNRLKKIKHYENWCQHPFVLAIVDHFNKNPSLDGENSKCDQVFSDYLLKVSKLVKNEIFRKILFFVFLFRECLNLINCTKLTTNDGKEYSETFNCEDAPDISNEFVTEFLEPEKGIFEFSKEEAIDLTQNFCQWLYDNNYTCSKLSLVADY